MREGQPDLVLPAIKNPARVVYAKVGSIQGVNIYQRMGDVKDQLDVENLPDRQPNTFFVVSRMVKDRIPERFDCVVPYGVFTDDSGVTRARGVAL